MLKSLIELNKSNSWVSVITFSAIIMILYKEEIII